MTNVLLEQSAHLVEPSRPDEVLRRDAGFLSDLRYSFDLRRPPASANVLTVGSSAMCFLIA
jgi:hypothetical protein